MIGIGLASASPAPFALSRALSSTLEPMLFQVTAADVTTFIVVPLLSRWSPWSRR